MSDVFWLHVVLVNIPVSDVRLLQERDREIPVIQTRVMSCARLPGREPCGAFGIRRVSVHPSAAAMTLAWQERSVGRSPQRRTQNAFLDRYTVIQFGGRCVLAQAFLRENDARDWAKDRHGKPVP
jgi:hypothetical protein